MEIKKYKFGGVVFQIISPLPLLEDERFEAFSVLNTEQEDYTYEILPENQAAPGNDRQEKLIYQNSPENGKQVNKTAECSIVQVRDEDYIRVYMDINLLPGITVSNLFSALRTSRLLLERGAFVLHCAYVLHGDKALLFCAPSGTGKSTQALYWQEAMGSVTVNEDRAIITVKDGVYYANGCWATGHSDICRNITAPLHRMILLGQGCENQVYRLSPVQMLKRILLQCSFDEEDSNSCTRIVNCVADLIDAVPVLAYDCVWDVSAVEELEKYL